MAEVLAFPHLERAAFLAICFLLLALSLFARAIPPFNPPLRPMVARYSEIAERAGISATGLSSSVEMRTMAAAS